MFASVRQHFDDPRVQESTLVTLGTDTIAAGSVCLTAGEAHDALYGPAAVPEHSTAIWEAVLAAARTDRTTDGTEKLLALWLALPRLTGTVHRICGRLRVDRSDVEAEMSLAFFEELAVSDDTDDTHGLSAEPLLKAARTRAWSFARAGLRERPSAFVEHIEQGRALVPESEPSDNSVEWPGLDVVIDRPDRPDGLSASLRFRARPEHLRADAFAHAGTEACGRPRGCPRKRRSRHRVGTLPIRPMARRP
ncbi:hypothetical protein ACGFRB_13520 [Streptomyces sp. NPDC048718]|uniref:hypothetical protein n=1 Tax=Streptomyces sp. NPDC048718 TaxID=3365587 RepID=UPI00372480CA